ncbi:MAG: LysM peptidoglycan-binding domain-containing protein [Lachnospiraceae bacterium]|nr:LysM peptidoglycan-binding domain-containing protein [Lachnospiraceae bacterium]
MNYEYCDGMTHTVKQGETLYSLSRQYNVPLAIILRANPYIDVYNLQTGDTICIPVRSPGQQGGGNCMSCGSMGMMPGDGMDDANNDDSMDNDDGGEDNDMDDYDSEEDDGNEGGYRYNGSRGPGMRVDMDTPGRMMDTGDMAQGNARGGMYSMGNMPGNSQEGCWVKYVAQAGDTLQDILDRSECTVEMFWEKNQADKMYMLPGVAYFILENCTD